MAIRLSPQRKRRIKHRAAVEARREYQPAINAARGEASAARRSYQRAAGAARGYTAYSVDSINKQIRQARRRGLGGQVIQTLRSDRSQAKAGLPYLLGDAQQQLSEDLATARSHITAARVDKLSHAGSNYTDLLNKAYKAKAERKASGSSSSSSGGDAPLKGIKAATEGGLSIAGKTQAAILAQGEAIDLAQKSLHEFLRAWKRNEDVNVGTTANPDMKKIRDLYNLKTGEGWAAVAHALAKDPGFNQLEAMAAIRNHLKIKRHKKRARRQALRELPALRGLP